MYFISEANTKKLFKDLLAVDYVLISVLLPFQIIGRLLGAVVNHKISYLSNLSAIAVAMIFLIWKMSKRCAEMSEEEKEVILRRNTGTFVSMNILRDPNYVPPKNDNSLNSHSNSSFSVDSDKGPATPFEIEEEGSLASSSPKVGFRMDESHSNKNFSANSRRRNHMDNLHSHSSSFSNVSQPKRSMFRSLLHSEQTHFFPLNLILLVLPLLTPVPLFYYLMVTSEAEDCGPKTYMLFTLTLFILLLISITAFIRAKVRGRRKREVGFYYTESDDILESRIILKLAGVMVLGGMASSILGVSCFWVYLKMLDRSGQTITEAQVTSLCLIALGSVFTSVQYWMNADIKMGYSLTLAFVVCLAMLIASFTKKYCKD